MPHGPYDIATGARTSYSSYSELGASSHYELVRRGVNYRNSDSTPIALDLAPGDVRAMLAHDKATSQRAVVFHRPGHAGTAREHGQPKAAFSLVVGLFPCARSSSHVLRLHVHHHLLELRDVLPQEVDRVRQALHVRLVRIGTSHVACS